MISIVVLIILPENGEGSKLKGGGCRRRCEAQNSSICACTVPASQHLMPGRTLVMCLANAVVRIT